MKKWVTNHHRIIFYSLWLLLGLLQSRYTELMDDEAYYWVYSRFLDWGYFDHPPMIALLIKGGYAIFPNELGVRLLPLLLNVCSLLLIENLLNKKNPWLFYAIAFSIAAIQVSGFVAVPDIPLIFFTALFFWCYRRFAANSNVLNSFLVGLAAALLLYSKYHAVLIIFFVLISNVRLFTRYQTYLAGIVALILFAPHLYWQYQHDWVSFRYHLFESNVSVYKASYTIEYVVGQLLLPGPIAGFILLPAAFLYKPADATSRALKFTLIGIYAFFLLSSFRGRVEGNWTSPVLVPLMVLSHQYLLESVQWKKWLYRLLPVTALLVIVVRVIMMVDILPVNAIEKRYHAWKQWPKELKEKTKGLPVVFSNSYQRASKYWFYTGQETYSQNNYQGRKNNYNFWPIEDELLGKPVYEMDIYRLERFRDTIRTKAFTVGYKYDSSFISFARINIDVKPASYTINEKDSLFLRCKAEVPESYGVFIAENTLTDTIRIAIFNKSGWQKDILVDWPLKKLINAPIRTISIFPALSKGEYYMRFAINNGDEQPTHNSDKIKLVVN